MTRPTTMLALLLITTGCHERGQSVSMSAEPTPAEADALDALDSGSISPGGDAGPTRLTQDGEVSPSPPAGQAMNGDGGGIAPLTSSGPAVVTRRYDECELAGELITMDKLTGQELVTRTERIGGLIIDDPSVTPETLLTAFAWGELVTPPGPSYCEGNLSIGDSEICEESSTLPARVKLSRVQLHPVPIDGGLWVACTAMTNIVVRYTVIAG